MFVDSSAWTAMLLEEPEAEAFREKIADAIEVTTSAIANWETVRAVARETNRNIEAVSQELRVLQLYARAQILPIGQPEQIVALDAHARFGKCAHPARLNMGDCFAYACATLRNLPLLYKGDDFSRTDITAA
jgi:ribonuclease VapC